MCRQAGGRWLQSINTPAGRCPGPEDQAGRPGGGRRQQGGGDGGGGGDEEEGGGLQEL